MDLRCAPAAIDTNLEGVYFLDYLTGNLKGVVISLATGKFTTFYEYNVLRDFQLDANEEPEVFDGDRTWRRCVAGHRRFSRGFQ